MFLGCLYEISRLCDILTTHNMIKPYYISLAILLAACSADDQETPSVALQPISIDLAVNAPASRATLYNSASELQGKQQIDIRLYDSSGSSYSYTVANGTTTTTTTPNNDSPYLDWQSSSWAFYKNTDGSNVRYFWPDTFTGTSDAATEKKVDFVAFAPHTSDVITNTSAAPSITSAGVTFDVTGIPLSDDIMVGKATGQSYSTANPVHLTMHHVLSAIDVVIVLSPRMTITELSISGIAKTGSYSGDGTTNTWTGTDGTDGIVSTTTFPDKNNNGTTGQIPGDINFGSSITPDAPFIVLPQTLSPSAMITLKALVNNAEKAYTFQLDTADPNHGSTTAAASWLPGYKYTYQLCINADDPEFGLVSVIVTPWDEQGTSDTDVE